MRLIFSATRPELEPLIGQMEDTAPMPLDYGEAVRGHFDGMPLVLAWFGVGKANTAAGLAHFVASYQPSLAIQVGIGGAFPGWDLELGRAAVAAEEVHRDLGVRSASGFQGLQELGFPLLTSPTVLYNRVPVDQDLSTSLAAGRWPLLPFGTSETVTGRFDEGPHTDDDSDGDPFRAAIESMEGAAAAQVCLALRVPFAEVRGISNWVGERDRSRWCIARAISSSHEVLERWLIESARSPGAH